jgi:fatty-acyl-CoA synthase
VAAPSDYQFDRDKVKLDSSELARWSTLTVPYLLERGGLDPSRTAIVFEGEQRTYGELRERARRVANGLIDRGIEPMDRVALLARNCLEYIEIEVGIAAARAIMVPLSWRLRPPELRNLLRRSEARAIIVEDRFAATIEALKADGELPDLELIVALGEQGDAEIGYEELCASSSAARPSREGQLEDPHEIIYTSGTTGEPKGAVWTNGTLIWNSIQQVMDYRLGPGDATFIAIDLHYIGGRHDFAWPMLHCGATVHVKQSSGWDAAEVLAYTAEHGISHVLWVPTMIYDMLEYDDLDKLDFSALKVIMCGGATITAELTRRVSEAFPSTDFLQVFGLTEGGGNVTITPADRIADKAGSAGKPAMHNEVRILADDGTEMPPGEPGEIVARGPAVTAGYWDAPERTAETVVDGWLHTGDMGYLDEEGFLYVSGRKKEMVISGGMNIFPAEIEIVLRGHDSVLDVSVIGLPDERWGERVVAVVEPNPEGPPFDEAELIELCRENLASYKKPTQVFAVDELPRTSSGKVQKFAVAELLREAHGVG